MTDWGASGRRDTYRYLVVDPFSLEATGEVEAISGSVTYGYNTDNKRECSVELAETWSGGLLRIMHTCEVGDETYEEALGTFFINSSGAKVSKGISRHRITGYSTLYRHTQDFLSNDMSFGAGKDIADIARLLVEMDGGTLTTAKDVVSRKLSQAHVFEMKDEKAKSTYLNMVAGWINAQIDVADTGEITLAKYYSPREKGIKYTFEEGAHCAYTAGYQLSDTTADAINRVVAYYTTNESTDRVTVDLAPTDPFSYENIGRRMTDVLSITEKVSHAQLLKSATDHLETCKGSSFRIEFEHAGIPGLRAGDVVRYVNHTDADTDVLAIIEQMEISLTPGMMTKTKARLI